jgi:SNF family Na+-dependent transporter
MSRLPSHRLAGVAGVLIMIAGIAGGITRIGLFFVPALAVLAVASARLWRERP